MISLEVLVVAPVPNDAITAGAVATVTDVTIVAVAVAVAVAVGAVGAAAVAANDDGTGVFPFVADEKSCTI